MTIPRPHHLLLGALALAGASAVHAADDWGMCGPAFVTPPRPVFESTTDDPRSIQIAADEVEFAEGGKSVLRGKVQVMRGPLQAEADRAIYDREQERIETDGRVQFWDDGGWLSGENAVIEVERQEASLGNAEFVIVESHARGTAERIVLSGEDVMRVRRGTYTTCNPDDEMWVLEARDLDLDRGDDEGVARDVWVRFGGVPIFWSPYLTFPLSDARKSGFLIPSFRLSGSSGAELTVPYYFNLAPEFDATVALRGMTDRGVQAQGEFRYLTRKGTGQIGLELLPNDSEYDGSRAALRFRHTGELDAAERWYAEADVGWVSDNDYFEDLGTNLGIAAQSHLERRADLTYRGDGWYARARVQDYQTLDDTIPVLDRPYERLPQLLVTTNGRERNLRLNVGGYAEFVSFDRSASLTGTRLDLRPTVSFPMRSAAAFLVPRASLRHTRYDLQDTAPGAADSPNRTVPTFSVDSGLFFERALKLGSRSFTQTLEPRIFYLYTPFEDQSKLPVFDTGQNTFSFSQLFREDRFNGADRVGDAHQVSLALTTRLLAPSSGEELVRASVGQIRYLRDREVTLPGRPREKESDSALVAELAASPTREWRFLGGIQWDPGDGRTDRNTVALRYQPDARRVVNLAYRFLREVPFASSESVEQTDFSVAWPVARDWRAVGRFNYALDRSTTLESFAGLEYESCCWALRTVFRRHLTSEGGEHTNSFFVQLELKGLTGVGRSTVDFLERSIPGYENEF
ncbi:MAG: LPS-assembly protein LptD [Ectothiorhodospiraceae bacterium]|nr:LPS-assembly protein LptD [Ectothiorhodospiraceae bacterium]